MQRQANAWPAVLALRGNALERTDGQRLVPFILEVLNDAAGIVVSNQPEKYRDTVRERVLEAINKKVDGQEITSEAPQDGGGKIIDLMEALKASLSKQGSDEAGERKAS